MRRAKRRIVLYCVCCAYVYFWQMQTHEQANSVCIMRNRLTAAEFDYDDYSMNSFCLFLYLSIFLFANNLAKNVFTIQLFKYNCL